MDSTTLGSRERGAGSRTIRSSACSPTWESQRRTSGTCFGSGYLSRHCPMALPRSMSLLEDLRRVRSEAGSEARNAVMSTGSRGSLRSEEHTSELQSRGHLVCRLLLEKKNTRAKHGGRQTSS